MTHIVPGLSVQNLAECPEHLRLVSQWMWGEWGSGDGRSVEDVEYRTRHAMGKDKVPMTFVAFLGGEPVATYSLWTNDLKSRQDLSPWLSVLFVVPEHRGKGIGSALLDHSVRQAKALGYGTLHLITDHVGFYEKSGWSFVEEAPLSNGKRTRIYRFMLN